MEAASHEASPCFFDDCPKVVERLEQGVPGFSDPGFGLAEWFGAALPWYCLSHQRDLLVLIKKRSGRPLCGRAAPFIS